MKKLMGALVGVATLAVAATTTVSTAQAQWSGPWSGIYFGANVGYMSADVDGTIANTGVGPPLPWPSNSPDSGIAGGQFGVQGQWGNFVLGVEFAADGTGAFGKDFDGAACPNAAFNCSSRVRGFWTIGPRLGWASGPWMLYLTGGYAQGRLETESRSIATGVLNDFTTARHDGWYAGAGVEWMLSRHFVFGLEYQHLDFDAGNHLSQAVFNHREMNLEADVVRARLSFIIGPREPDRPLK